MIEDLSSFFDPTKETFNFLKFSIEFYNNNIDLITRFDECLEKYFEKRGQTGRKEQNIMVDLEKSLIEAGFDEEIIDVAYSFAIGVSTANINGFQLPTQDYTSTAKMIKDVLERSCTEQRSNDLGDTAYSFDVLALLIQENFKISVSAILQNREPIQQIVNLLDQQPDGEASTVKVFNKFRLS